MKNWACQRAGRRHFYLHLVKGQVLGLQPSKITSRFGSSSTPGTGGHVSQLGCWLHSCIGSSSTSGTGGHVSQLGCWLHSCIGIPLQVLVDMCPSWAAGYTLVLAAHPLQVLVDMCPSWAAGYTLVLAFHSRYWWTCVPAGLLAILLYWQHNPLQVLVDMCPSWAAG
jgi:hypothetical protein